MARTEKVTVTYETVLLDGLRENNMAGVVEDGEDEPFKVRLVRTATTRVIDGRGTNWRDSSTERDTIVDLTLEQAADLAKSIVSDIAYAATVAERRVLIPEPEEEG